MNLYDRRWKVELNNQPFIDEIKDPIYKSLNCRFKVENEFGGVICYLVLELFNLKNDTQQKLEKDAVLSLSAGYAGHIGEIFYGTIVNVYTMRQGTDLITKVTCTAGGLSRKKKPIVNAAFAQDTHVTEMIEACTNAMQYSLIIDKSQFKADEKSKSSASLMGDAITVLDKLAKEFNFVWAIEGQTIVVLKSGTTRKGQTLKISRSTGMIGVPKYNETGFDVSIRINPEIRIGF